MEPAPATKVLLTGARIGRYVLEEPLGSGAMSLVYRARHADNGREVAIKLLHSHLAARRIYIQRLRREAVVGVRIRHPNVLKMLELGTSPEHGPFLVMEHVHGRTLYDVIQEQAPFLPRRAAAIAQQIALGLGAVHEAGYVHRDLKPGNLMLEGEPGNERVKILDFGIVGICSDTPQETQLTGERWMLGTPSYMAPEQFESTDVGPPADLYALGVVLYQMLTGQVPFTGPLTQLIAFHMTKAPPPIAELAGLGPLALWLLSKLPQKRPATALRVAQMLELMRADLATLPALPRASRAPLSPATIAERPSERPRLQIAPRLPAVRTKRSAIAIYATATALGISTGLVAHGVGGSESAEAAAPSAAAVVLECPPQPEADSDAPNITLIAPSYEPAETVALPPEPPPEPLASKPVQKHRLRRPSRLSNKQDVADLRQELEDALDAAIEPALYQGDDI